MADFAIWGPIAPEDLPGLCDRVCALLHERGPGPVRCDVTGVAPDAVTVDALARLQLTRIGQRCARALAQGGLSDEVQSHLLETRARIERSLEATRDVPNPPPANPFAEPAAEAGE